MQKRSRAVRPWLTFALGLGAALLLGRNEIWRTDLAGVSDPAWATLLASHADAAVARGFNGFFLDTADSLESLIRAHPDRAQAFREGLLRAVKALNERKPSTNTNNI